MSGKRGRLCAVLVVAAVLSGGGAPARAQVLSPGRLSAVHEQLEGIRQCTSCHQLGQRGAGTDRCLACHESLGERVKASLGYHATVRDQSCGSCHAEHYGRDFALIRLDTTAFDHASTGYTLRSAHAEVSCRSCHRADFVRSPALRAEKKTAAALERTFLGLATTCRSCHEPDDSHGRQFGAQDCASCHAETRWTEADGFDHSAVSFRLTGAHRRVECSACHATKQRVTQYRGVAHQSCTSCHTDPHRGAQGATCSTCHTTSGWRDFGSGFDPSRFDHDRTDFRLREAHARLECGACHRSPARNDARIKLTLARASSTSRFPGIVVRDCRSCHVQAHPGAKRDSGAGADCVACHGERAWSPAAFGTREHAGTRFPLDGAHVLLSCAQCHRQQSAGRLSFVVRDMTCSGCHASVNPHGRAYADAQGRTECARCHMTGSWQPTAVRHESFPLEHGHAGVACASCHTPERSRAPRECEACHAAADPHGGRSAGRGCGDCHGVDGFDRATRFDHSTTRYPLEGAHAGVVCRACHVPEPAPQGAIILRYTPLSIRCEDCHGA
ncbi:MAG TPA: hypothetical protein VFZ24_05945 [Longimicrobiales bacterium]